MNLQTNLKTSLEAVVSEKEVGFGKVMMPVRIATTGQALDLIYFRY